MEQNASIVHDGTGAIRSYFGDCYHFSEIAQHFFMNFENLQFARELLTCGLKSVERTPVRHRPGNLALASARHRYRSTKSSSSCLLCTSSFV